jgi:TolB-like protein/tetratricopeptide (TPR) repeat protein
VAGQVPDVFISYKAEDRARLKPLVDALEAEGFIVWWDAHIGGGANWRRDIEEHLDSAKCVLVAWTKRAVGPAGEFVRDEAGQARRRGTYLPVRFDAVDLPLGFREVQAISLKGWHGDRSDPRFHAVIDAVRTHVLGEQAHAPHGPFDIPQVSRRAVVAGSAVAAAAIAGIGAWALLKPGKAAASRSIAVLPFSNLSGDPKQVYFSDGIAEEIRSALTRIAGLQVAGSTSSEAVRNDDAETAAKKLGVANILTGSVRQSPSTIRITAELIDGRTGLDRWSQDYDRDPGDSIKIQTDIAENVASALRGALGVVERAAITVGGTSNPEAQRLVLEAIRIANSGMSFAGQVSVANFQRALQLIDQALALDPNYADAYAHKAVVVTGYASHFGRSGDLARARAEAMDYAKKAVAIAPNLPSAHLALSVIYRGDLNLADAERELDRSVALAPNDPEILRNQATLLSVVGKFDEAVAVANRAVNLDPLNGISYGLKMVILYLARRYGDGVETAEAAPKHLFVSYFKLGDCLVMLGRNQDALRAYESGPRDDVFQLVGEGVLAARTGDRAGALTKVNRMRQLFGDAASFQFAQIYAQLGQADDAFANLDRAWAVKDPALVTVKVDPLLDPIRNDPRYAILIRNLRIP